MLSTSGALLWFSHVAYFFSSVCVQDNQVCDSLGQLFKCALDFIYVYVQHDDFNKCVAYLKSVLAKVRFIVH
jgi:hypothetical protein